MHAVSTSFCVRGTESSADKCYSEVSEAGYPFKACERMAWCRVPGLEHQLMPCPISDVAGSPSDNSSDE
jgi:hypothetical protein